MKIIEKFILYHNFLKSHHKKIKKIFFILTTIALIRAIIPEKYKIKNEDYTQRPIQNEKIYNYLKNKLYFKDEEFNTKKNLSDRETILIRGCEKQKKYFLILAESLLKLNLKRRNFKIILNDKEKFKNFFIKINLNFNKNEEIENNLIYLPNSDFYFLTKEYFKNEKIKFNFNDLIFHKNYSNEIFISTFDFKKIINYLRCISNIDNHTFGTFFYFTIYDHFFDGILFFPFFIFLSIFHLIDFFLVDFFDFDQKKFKENFFYDILKYVLFLRSPIFCLFSLGERSLDLSLKIIFFSVINFKIGILFSMAVYFLDLLVYIK